MKFQSDDGGVAGLSTHVHQYLDYTWGQVALDADILEARKVIPKPLAVKRDSPAHRREAARFWKFWRTTLRLNLLTSSEFSAARLAESILDAFHQRIPTRRELEQIAAMCRGKAPGDPGSTDEQTKKQKQQVASMEGIHPEVLNFASKVVAAMSRVPDELLDLAGHSADIPKPRGYPPGELIIRKTAPGQLGLEVLPKILMVDKMMRGDLHRPGWQNPTEQVKLLLLVDTSGSMKEVLPFAVALGMKLAETAKRAGNQVVMRYYASRLGPEFTPDQAIPMWAQSGLLGGGNNEGKVIRQIWQSDSPPDQIIIVTDGGIEGDGEPKLGDEGAVKNLHWFLTTHYDQDVVAYWPQSTVEIRKVEALA